MTELNIYRDKGFLDSLMGIVNHCAYHCQTGIASPDRARERITAIKEETAIGEYQDACTELIKICSECESGGRMEASLMEWASSIIETPTKL